MASENENPRAPYTGQADRGKLKFLILYTNPREVKLGARLNGHFYAQVFPRETLLGDACDVVRARVVRLASGLVEPEDAPTNQKDIF